MPSKYVVEADGAILAQQLGARWTTVPVNAAWKAEVFRKYRAPVVVWSDGGRLLRSMQLGFFPPFARTVKADCLPNARWEDLMERPTFRESFLHTRCLVPLTGFHEYSEFDAVPKWYGWFAPKDGRVGVAAGLWTTWQPSETGPIDVFALITRQAPENAMKVGVTRIPVWLPPESWDRWLDPAQHNPGTLKQILANFDSLALTVEQRTPPSRKKVSSDKKPGSEDKQGKSNSDCANLSFDFPADDE